MHRVAPELVNVQAEDMRRPVHEHLGAEPLGLGLYLSRQAAREVDPPALRDLLTSPGQEAMDSDKIVGNLLDTLFDWQ